MSKKCFERMMASLLAALMLTGISFGTLLAEPDEIEDPAVSEEQFDPGETISEESPIDAFVIRLYEYVLQRTPEESEVAFWAERLASGSTAADTVVGFLTSEEFQNRNTSDHDFVQVLYQALLDREGSEQEIAFWTDLMMQGRTRSFVIAGFINSEEFGNLCSAFGIEKGSYASDKLPDTDPFCSGFVARLYRYCLNRKYDEAGLLYWMDELRSGRKGGLEVATGFFESEEFLNRGLRNEQYVDVCYHALLGRDPDESGFFFWLDKLSTGEMTRQQIFELFCDSEEFKNLCASYAIMHHIPTIRELYPEACAVLDQVGWDLRSAYKWSVGITYVRSGLNESVGTRELAHIGFSTRKGNCYVYAATFYEMAIVLGYDAHQIVGGVVNLHGGLSPHSWVEIDMEGTTYVFDPEFEQTRSGRDGWKFHYGRKNTWVYAQYRRIN